MSPLNFVKCLSAKLAVRVAFSASFFSIVCTISILATRDYVTPFCGRRQWRNRLWIMHKRPKLTSVGWRDSVTRGEKLTQTLRLCRFLSKARGLRRQVRNIYSADYAAAARDNSSRYVRRKDVISLCKTSSIEDDAPFPRVAVSFLTMTGLAQFYLVSCNVLSIDIELLDRKLTEIQLQSDRQSDERRQIIWSKNSVAQSNYVTFVVRNYNENAY